MTRGPTEFSVRARPAFCPVCGQDLSVYTSLNNHLWGAHRIDGRDRLRISEVVWREVSCAVLEIIDPEWDGP